MRQNTLSLPRPTSSKAHGQEEDQTLVSAGSLIVISMRLRLVSHTLGVPTIPTLSLVTMILYVILFGTYTTLRKL